MISTVCCMLLHFLQIFFQRKKLVNTWSLKIIWGKRKKNIKKKNRRNWVTSTRVEDTSFGENFSWNFSYSMIPETLGNINLLMLRILNYVFLEMRKHWNFLSVWCNSMILMRGYLQLRNIFWMFILTVILGYQDFYVSWIHIFCNVILLN